MKIAVITGSRADKGPLTPVYIALQAKHDVRWVGTPHERWKNGSTSWDSGIAAAMSCHNITFELYDNKTDLAVLLGDRYEILGAAMGANILGIPIAHLSGGDLTEGSQDDCFRHAITKLSHIHFPTNLTSAERIIQMGEDPASVHMVGCPGIDRILNTKLFTYAECIEFLNLKVNPFDNILLVSLHPNTHGHTETELNALMPALKAHPNKDAIVLIGPNTDAGNNLIRVAFKDLSRSRSNTVYFENLPDNVYISLLKYADVMIGNSSAAFYEAPSFNLPVVNIGARQKGRIGTARTIHAFTNPSDVKHAIKTALRLEKHGTVQNPYGDGKAAHKIEAIISNLTFPLMRKRFYSKGEHAWPSVLSGTASTKSESGVDTPMNTSSDGLLGTTTEPPCVQPFAFST